MASPTACAKLIVFLSAACLAAQGATAKAEPVMRMLAALGGMTAIDKLTSLSVEADCTGPSGPFRTSVQSLRPGRVYFIQTSDKGTTRIWSTPTRTWTIDGGKVETLGETVRAFVRGHEFHLLLFEVHSRFPKREAGGDEVLDGREFTRVLMTDEGGNSATLLLDKTSFLPRRLEINPPGAQGPIRIFFDDWRRIGGLLYFESFRLTEGSDRTFTYRYTKIAPNTVEASLFAEPTAPNSSRPEWRGVSLQIRTESTPPARWSSRARRIRPSCCWMVGCAKQRLPPIRSSPSPPGARGPAAAAAALLARRTPIAAAPLDPVESV